LKSYVSQAIAGISFNRSDFTRIRVAQNKFDALVDNWAVDNVYMGPTCPMYCRNHGACRNGVCM